MTPPPPTPDARQGRENDARFGAARDGVAVLSPDWRIRYANASLLEILSLIGRTGVERLWDALPEWEESPEAGELRRAMTERVALCFRVGGSPGAGRVWEVQAEPLVGGDLRVHIRNVTAAARLEEMERGARSLSERAARLDVMVAGAPAGIVLMDAATLVVREANAAYHTMLEKEWREPGAILGKSFFDFIPQFEESGTAAIFRRVAESGEPFEVAEYEFHGFARGTTYFRWTLTALDGEDGARYLLLLIVEVTSLVLARRAVEAERKALYDVLDTLPVGVAVANAPDGRMDYMNAAAVALGGRAAEELAAPDIGEYVARWRLFHPSGHPFATGELPMARALRGESTREVEMVLRLPEGEERTVLASGAPLRDADGEVDRALVAFYDVTDRLRLERELVRQRADAEAAASEAALRAEESRALKEIGRALVSELEPERVLHLAVRHAMELPGARGSVVVTPLPDGRMRLSPAVGALASLDGAVFPYAGSVAQQVAHAGVARVFNSLEEIPPTSPVLAEVRRLGMRNLAFVPLRAFGETFGVLVAVDREDGFREEDALLLAALADSAALAIHNTGLYLAERRRADESRALLTAAEALTSTLDPAEVMERIVRVARELAGADGAGVVMVVGEARERIQVGAADGCLAALPRESSPIAGSLTERVILGALPPRFSADALPEDDPAGRYMATLGAAHYAFVPLRAGDEVLGVLGAVNGEAGGPFPEESLHVLSLLAGQAAIAVRNARLYEGAQAASRAKSEFLAMMSHELRTPLNALEGYASLLEDGIYGEVNDRQKRALERMRSARLHLVELIERVLDVARVEAGVKRPTVVDVDLSRLAREVAEALRGAAERKGLGLVVETDGPAPVHTDAGMVRQILTNLLGNAFKFTEAGEVRLRVGVDGERVAVEVTDTGPGIAPEHQERIFEPFFQVDPSTTRREGGTGLGLALSREFARLLRGDIIVRSRPGEGSTFTFTLPRGTEAG